MRLLLVFSVLSLSLVHSSGSVSQKPKTQEQLLIERLLPHLENHIPEDVRGKYSKMKTFFTTDNNGHNFLISDVFLYSLMDIFVYFKKLNVAEYKDTEISDPPIGEDVLGPLRGLVLKAKEWIKKEPVGIMNNFEEFFGAYDTHIVKHPLLKNQMSLDKLICEFLIKLHEDLSESKDKFCLEMAEICEGIINYGKTPINPDDSSSKKTDTLGSSSKSPFGGSMVLYFALGGVGVVLIGGVIYFILKKRNQ